jgi:hypothetical protein
VRTYIGSIVVGLMPTSDGWVGLGTVIDREVMQAACIDPGECIDVRDADGEFAESFAVPGGPGEFVPEWSADSSELPFQIRTRQRSSMPVPRRKVVVGEGNRVERIAIVEADGRTMKEMDGAGLPVG